MKCLHYIFPTGNFNSRRDPLSIESSVPIQFALAVSLNDGESPVRDDVPAPESV